MGTYRRKRKVHDKGQNLHEHHPQHQQQHANLANNQYFQRYYKNQQPKPFEHPVFNLPIPAPTAPESQYLNDEVDMYVVRNVALHKFKMSNDLLDNIIVKAIPANRIIPPASYPVCMIEGKVWDGSEKPEGWLEKVKQDGHGTFILGSQEALKVREEFQAATIKQLEDDKDNGLAKLPKRYSLQSDAVAKLKKLYMTYSPLKAAEYDSFITETLGELRATGSKIVDDEKVNKHKVDGFDQAAGVSYAEYKKAVADIAEQKRLEEEELAKKTQEAEAAKKAAEEAAIKAAEAQQRLELEKIQAAQLEAQVAQQVHAQTTGQPVDPTEKRNSSNEFDLFGTESNDTFDFNIYTNDAEGLIQDSEELGALEDHVWDGLN